MTTDAPHLTTIEPDAETTAPGRGARAATSVLTFVLGAVYGTVGTVAHPLTLRIGELQVPYGIVLALIGVLALVVGLRLVLGDRLPVLTASVGLIGVVVLFSFRSVGGSVFITQGLVGMLWLFGVPLIAALALAWPSLPPRRATAAAA